MTAKTALILFAALSLGLSGPAQDQLPRPDRMGVTNTGPYDYGVMGPPATPAIAAAADKSVAKPMPNGPFQPSWDSLRRHYRTRS
jgi:alpha-L-fucosidase